MNDDLIRRQDVKNWFCTNYCSEHNKCGDYFAEEICYSMSELKNLPSAGPQIVRCKECIHHDVFGRTTKYYGCNYYYMAVDADHFCKKGERRADE